METLFWYQNCALCRQGRLFLFRNIDLDKLYLHCEECEEGYYDPEHIDTGHSFLTLTEDFESEAATWDDIVRLGWSGLQISVMKKG